MLDIRKGLARAVGKIRAFDGSGSGRPASSTNSNVGGLAITRQRNSRTGMGTDKDKAQGVSFYPHVLSERDADILYQMSWVAQKMIDIPVNDMFFRGRQFTSDESAAEKMVAAEKELKSYRWLKRAMKAGSLHGSALLIIYPKDKSVDMEKEADFSKIEVGGIANLRVVNRWQCQVKNWQTETREEGFGEPYQYWVHKRGFSSPALAGKDPGDSLMFSGARSGQDGQETIHHSWCLRFDGQSALSSEGWHTGPFHREWGISELTKALDEIQREAGTTAGVAHLVQEASIWVQKVHGFKEALSGRGNPADASLEDIAMETSVLKSIYRSLFIDAEDDATRVNVSFAGLPLIMDRMGMRMAAIADIPYTRFMSQSPAGMNATGDSDADNYGLMVAAKQQEKLTDPLMRLDLAISRHAGLDEPPEYEWLPLFDLSEEQQALADKARTESVSLAYKDAAIDEDEYREQLSKMPWWGVLGEWGGDPESKGHPANAPEPSPRGRPQRGRPEGGKA